MDEEENEQSTVKSLEEQKEESKQAREEAKERVNNNRVVKAAKNAVKTFIRTHIVQICIGIATLFLILVIIGILQFLLSMPGMLLGKLKEFGQTLLSNLIGAMTGDNISYTIDKEDEVALAQYIQDMGYDVVGYGFADAKYEVNENEAGDTGIENSTISDVKGLNGRNYIQQYLVQNEAIYTLSVWSIKGWLNTWGGITGDEEEFAKGMININVDDEEFWDIYHIVDNYNNLVNRFEIDPEKKALRIKSGSGIFFWDTEDYYFDMSNWTSKYGKPMELFLALHLSTMMPDLAYDIATKQEFNTKVNIDMKPITVTNTAVTWGDTTYNSVEEIDAEILNCNINISNWRIIRGLSNFTTYSDEEIDAQIAYYENRIEKLEKLKDLLNETHNVYWPRITSVTNHWFYKEINFEDTYEQIDSATQQINYEAADEYDPLYNENVTITATLSGGVFYQLTEPEIDGPNDAIVDLFKNGMYYRYDGTKTTAKEIANAKSSSLTYEFMGQTYNKEPNKVSKEPVTFIDTDNDDSPTNSYKNAFSAFAILQNSKTEEAEECYRCLKKLLVELEYFTEDELKDLFTQVLDWFMPDNKREGNITKDFNKYGIIVKDSKDKSIEAPGDGEIIAVDNNSIIIKFTKLNDQKLRELENKVGQEYNVDDNILIDMEMVIVGINPSVQQGQIVKMGDDLGKASEDEVQVYMKYSDGSIVDDVRTYMDIVDITGHGVGIGSADIVEIAKSQIGNIGGETYWRWYGFDSRVDWCACFVSWCANQCGYIDAGLVPRFSSVRDGANWFKGKNLWQDNNGSYTPKPRRHYILFMGL